MNENQITMNESIKSILSKELKIEDRGGKRYCSLPTSAVLPNYQKNMLIETGFPNVLPMEWITECESQTIYYDFTGLMQMEIFLKKVVSDQYEQFKNKKLILPVLNILHDVLFCMKGLEEYLIFSESYVINSEIIFIDSTTGRALLALFPNEEKECAFPDRMIGLIMQMISVCRDSEIELYLNQLQDYIKNYNPGLDGMIGMIGNLQRNLSCIYHETTELRSIDFKEQNCQTKWEHEEASIDSEPFKNKNAFIDQIKNGIMPSQKIAIAAAIQILFIAILCFIILYHEMEVERLTGLAILMGGCDLMLMRRLHQSE